MKLSFKLCLVFIIIILLLGFTIKSGIDMKYENDLKAIEDSRDLRLENFENNKRIAEMYLDTYKISDEASYQSVKNSLFNYLSIEMQNELFSSVNYKGLNYHKREVQDLNIVGTNLGENSKNTFMLEYRLTGVNYDQQITNLVYIENGVITKVIRIK